MACDDLPSNNKTALSTIDMPSSSSGIACKVVDWREERRTSLIGLDLSQLSSSQGRGGSLSGYQECELEIALDEIPDSELFSVDTLDELEVSGSLACYFSNLLELSSSSRPACSVRRDKIALSMVSTIHRLAEGKKSLLSKEGKEIVDRIKTAKDVLELLVPELDSLTSTAICALVENVLQPGIRRWEINGGVKEDDTADHVRTFLLGLQLLPKLLGLLMTESSLPECSYVPPDLVSQPGSMLVDESLAKLCSVSWPRRCAAAIIECIRDAPMNNVRREAFIVCGLKCLYQIGESFSAAVGEADSIGCRGSGVSLSTGADRGRIELNEVPPLVHQLLLISSRQCAGFPVAGVCKMFDSLHSWAGDLADEVVKVEGAVLLQFQYVMRQDNVLADAVLSTLQLQPDDTSKVPNSQGSHLAFGIGFKLPSPFRLALLLSLATVQRFQNKVMNELCGRFHAMVVHEMLCCRNPWLAQLSQSSNYKSSGPCGVRWGGTSFSSLPQVSPSHGSLSGSLSRLVSSALLSLAKSSRGWDTLFPSLVLLGNRLLESGGKDCIGGGKESFYAKLNASESLHSHHQLAEVGRALLLETFTQHQPSRRGLLNAALQGSLGLASCAMQYVKFLGDIAKVAPQLLLDEGDCIHKTLAEVGSMPPRVAQILLEVLHPLLHLRPSLQDTLMVPLRKALFNREVGARTVAVYGLIALVRVKMSLCSQTRAQRAEGDGGSYGMPAFTLVEGFDLLRRCLTQQPAVRVVLYDELVKIYKSESASRELQLFILTLLHRHMRQYIASEYFIDNKDAETLPNHLGGGTLITSTHRCGRNTMSLPSLLLDRALDRNCIIEPLPMLLGALGSIHIYHHKKKGAKNNKSFAPSLSTTKQDIDSSSGPTPLTNGHGNLSSSTSDLDQVHESLALEMNFIIDGLLMSPLDVWEVCKLPLHHRGDKRSSYCLSRASLLVGVMDVLAAMIIQLHGNVEGDCIPCYEGLPPKAAQHLMERKLEVLELVKKEIMSYSKTGKAKAAPKSTQMADELIDMDTQRSAVPLSSKSLGASTTATTNTVLLDHLPCSGLHVICKFLSAMNAGTESDSLLLDTALVQHMLASAHLHLNELYTGAPIALSIEMGGGVLPSAATGPASTMFLQDGTSAALLHSRALSFAHSLAPLLLVEFERSRAEGKSSYRALQEAAGKKCRKVSPDESLAEIALSGFGICVCIASEDILNPIKEVENLLTASLERRGGGCVSVVSQNNEESISRLIVHLNSLDSVLDVLLEEGDSKEAVLLLQVMQRIVALVTGNRSSTSSCVDLKPHVDFLYGRCASCRIKAPPLAKELISTLLQASLASQPMGGSLEILQVVSLQIAQCMGGLPKNTYPNRKEDEGGGSDSDSDSDSCAKPSVCPFACINKGAVYEATGKESKGTVDSACDSLITCMDCLMREVEVAVDCLVKASGSLAYGMKIKKMVKHASNDNNESQNKMDFFYGTNLAGDGLDRSLDALESLICVRLNNVLKAVQVAISYQLRNVSAEKMLKVVLRGQKALGKVLSARCRTARGWVSEGLKLLLNNRRTFCKQVHVFLLGFHKATISTGSHADTQKHSRTVPDLLYQTENCDRLVINLAKLHKVSPKISRWVFNAQARDFKIDSGRATNMMEKEKRELEQPIMEGDSNRRYKQLKGIYRNAVEKPKGKPTCKEKRIDSSH